MYIALKPCRFKGEQFKIGDKIDESFILPEAIRRLTHAGIIAVADGNPPTVATSEIKEVGKLHVPIYAEEGITRVELTPEELVEVVSTMQKTTSEITEAVKTFESTDQLLLLSVLNGTDEVYEASKERVAELMGEEPEEEVVYSKRTLERMNRNELIELAHSHGIETSDDMSKKKLAELIMEKQGV